MLIAQISDLHVGLPGSDIDRHFRTTEHLDRAVTHLNSRDPLPAAVWVTGDLVDEGSPAEYRRARSHLDQLTMPYFVIPGNHDHREHLLAAFADHVHLPRGGFIQYVVDQWPVRLIGLDTLVPGKPGGALDKERLAWLEAVLSAEPSRPTMLFMHHPPFRTGIKAMDDMGLADASEFASVVARHPQVERIACGHVHRPMTTRFAGTIASTCPSTAHQAALDLGAAARLSLIMERPACALHWWQPLGGVVTHSSVIGQPTPAIVVLDESGWRSEVNPPDGFHDVFAKRAEI